MPAIFIAPKPHTTFILQILKDQAHTNEKDKKRWTHHNHDISPLWEDLPDNWDFDHYNHWDVPATSD